MTGLDLIEGAMRLINVLAEGESASSDSTDTALSALNDMLDSWSNEGLIAFPVVRESFAFSVIGLLQTYSWGSTGAFGSARPQTVKKGLIQLSGSNPPLELPLPILNMEEYSAVTLKTLTSTFPLYCYIDDAYPASNVSVWPVPTDSTNSLIFYSVKPLSSAILNSALSVPPGYLRAMRFALAIELASEFGKTVPEATVAIAVQAKAVIKRNNLKPHYLIVDAAVRSSPAVYNWRTDGYDR